MLTYTEKTGLNLYGIGGKFTIMIFCQRSFQT